MLLTEETLVCPNPWCRLDLRVNGSDHAFMRAREDKVFFWHYFLLRCPHPGQVEFIQNSEASVNLLACANRYGKTTLLAGEHFHANVFKTGAEPRYMGDDGRFDGAAFMRERYRTVHTAGEWDQAAEVREDAFKLISDSPRLDALIKGTPSKSVPSHIEFYNGARWLFRTLGVNASGIDGKNFYLLSIDEGGWIRDLLSMMDNVLRIRVADVRGRILIVGTFKPGMGKDFFKIAVKASSYTGASIGFDHRSADGEQVSGGLDAALYKYARESGFDLEGEIAKLKAMDGNA